MKYGIILVIIFMISCKNDDTNEDGNSNALLNPAPPMINYSVVNIFPHDTAAFTEGLLVHNGQLYESTGGQPRENHFKSWLGLIDIKTGKAQKKIMLDTAYFGEGVSLLNGKIYQLTWKNQKGFIYDAKSLKKLKEFAYTGQGWSLTNDGHSLIMSDGSNKLQYLDADSLKLQKIVGVEDNNGPVGNINELEYINGFIYANQWGTSYVLKIDPESGKCVGKIDFTSLDKEVRIKHPQALEMNGIAYDSAAKRMYVTGKAWPNLYEVRLN